MNGSGIGHEVTGFVTIIHISTKSTDSETLYTGLSNPTTATALKKKLGHNNYVNATLIPHGCMKQING